MISFVVWLSCAHGLQEIIDSRRDFPSPQFDKWLAYQALEVADASTISDRRRALLKFLGTFLLAGVSSASARTNGYVSRKDADKNALVRKTLLDATNQFSAGNGKAGVRIKFPSSLCDENGDRWHMLKQLRRFLQEPGADNDDRPIFPRSEYVLLLSPPITREASEAVSRLHVDAEGGPRYILFFLHAFSVDLPPSKVAVIEKAVADIFSYPDPKERFDEAGILTCNAWWVCRGKRKLALMGQHAFAKLSNGKSLWDFFAHRRKQGFCDDIGPFPVVADDSNTSEAVEATRCHGVIFNSALNLHRGYDNSSGVGCSRECRIVAFPVAFLNKIANANVDWVGLAGLDMENRLRTPSVSPLKWDGGSTDSYNAQTWLVRKMFNVPKLQRPTES